MNVSIAARIIAPAALAVLSQLAVALPTCDELANQSRLRLGGKSADKQPRRGTPAHRRAERALLQSGFRILGRVRPVGGIPARTERADHDSRRLAAEQRRHGESDRGGRRAVERQESRPRRRWLRRCRRRRHRVHQSWLCRHVHRYRSQRREREFRIESRRHAQLWIDQGLRGRRNSTAAPLGGDSWRRPTTARRPSAITGWVARPEVARATTWRKTSLISMTEFLPAPMPTTGIGSSPRSSGRLSR